MRGTVRSTTNEAKIAPLKAGFGEYFDQLELVEADLLNEASILTACAGSTYVIHTASPFTFSKEDAEIIKVAVEGSMAVMKACTAAGVKRCVVTSSVAAIAAMAKEDSPAAGQEINESHWSNPDRSEGLNGYFKSKTLAEKACWDYQAAQPEAQRFEIVVINPVFIMGPSICSGDGFSEDYMTKLLDGTKDKIARNAPSWVDVRDTALAHLKAIQVAEAANKRVILCACETPLKDVCGYLAKYN